MNTKIPKTTKKYSWQDWFTMTFFSFYAIFGIINLHSASMVIYNYATIPVGIIGLLAVLMHFKRLEAIMIVTWALLLFTRSILFIPLEDVGAVDFFSWVHYVLFHRPLADASIALLMLMVLANYRGHKGRIK